MPAAEFIKRIFAPDPFRPRNLLTPSEREEVQEKIKAIEKEAHSKIAIHVIRDHKGNLYERAVKEFSRHKLFHKEIKTGVLLLISLKSRQFQILGDEHIHEKLGENGWNQMASKLSDYFKDGKYFEGISFFLDDLGAHLRAHFPRTTASSQKDDEKNA